MAKFSRALLGELEEELRAEILRQLKRVTAANSPNLFEMIQTPQGYAETEKMIINKVIHDHMVPAAVIPILESELEMI